MFQIIRVAGYKKSAVGGIQIHDQREKTVSHTNEDIDWARTGQNYDVHSENSKDISFTTKINERIESLKLPRALRKDANVMAQCFISASPEFFQKADEQTQRRYFEDAYNFIAERYGKENIISAKVHLDEATPHMHINFIPVTEQGKVCYADLFTEKPQKSRGRDGGQLTALHDDFHEYNQQKGFNLERGESQTVTGKKEHLAVLDFKKQERAKEVDRLDENLGHLENKILLATENLSELRNLSVEHMAGNLALEEERNALQGQIEGLQGQLKAMKNELDAVEGKILTKKGIDKIMAKGKKAIFRTAFGKEDMTTMPHKDFQDLGKTALASERVESNEEISTLKAENKELSEGRTKDKNKIRDLYYELSSAQSEIKQKNTTISRQEQKLSQNENWHSKYQVADGNYKRVLKELNELKGLKKSKSHEK